eukprot:3872435-Rhodomonas_salina.2
MPIARSPGGIGPVVELERSVHVRRRGSNEYRPFPYPSATSTNSNINPSHKSSTHAMKSHSSPPPRTHTTLTCAGIPPENIESSSRFCKAHAVPSIWCLATNGIAGDTIRFVSPGHRIERPWAGGTAVST